MTDDNAERVWLMIRKPNRWELYGTYPDRRAAEREWAQRISGRGITAWSEFVSPEWGRKMLLDPSLGSESRKDAR